MASRLPACVVDVGTGYTKLGFAGNTEPQYIFPSTIAVKDKEVVASKQRGVEDLDFFIGDECMKPNTKIGEPKVPRPGYAIKYPLRHGMVDDWDLMVKSPYPSLRFLSLVNRLCTAIPEPYSTRLSTAAYISIIFRFCVIYCYLELLRLTLTSNF